MKLEDSALCIVTDELNRPMSWSKQSEQLCYCDDERYDDNPHVIRIVTVRTARKQIARTKANRKKWGFETMDNYYIMPVKI